MTRHFQNPSRRAFLFGRRFALEEDGATAIEYGLIGALIAVVMIPGFAILGGKIDRHLHCTRRAVKFNGEKANTYTCYKGGPRDKELRKLWRQRRREQRRRDRQQQREQKQSGG